MSTAVTDTDRGIVVTVACWLCLVCNILFFGARVHIRWPLKNLVGKDDIACTFAMVSSSPWIWSKCERILQVWLIWIAGFCGGANRPGPIISRQWFWRDPRRAGYQRGTYGRKGERPVCASQDRWRRANWAYLKMIWTSDLFYVLSVAGGRLATVGLLLRFCAAPDRIRIFRAFMYAVGIYGVVGLLITALRQDILHPWRYTANAAQTNFHRWIAFGCMGIVIDVLTMIAPLYLIWDVQMSRRTKTTVVAAFASRAPTIAFTVLRLVSLSSLDGDNFTWTYVIPEVYTQLEMHYNLIAATIPCLRIFLRAWHTRFLNMALEELDEQAFVERKYRCTHVQRACGPAESPSLTC